jgi:hypothetical protein
MFAQIFFVARKWLVLILKLHLELYSATFAWPVNIECNAHLEYMNSKFWWKELELKPKPEDS